MSPHVLVYAATHFKYIAVWCFTLFSEDNVLLPKHYPKICQSWLNSTFSFCSIWSSLRNQFLITLVIFSSSTLLAARIWPKIDPCKILLLFKAGAADVLSPHMDGGSIFVKRPPFAVSIMPFRSLFCKIFFRPSPPYTYLYLFQISSPPASDVFL